MPRRGQHDQSPGDARKRFSDEGGPEGRHARTHDTRREQATRAKPDSGEGDEFAADLQAEHSDGGHIDESVPAVDDKGVRQELPGFDRDDLKQLSILTVGTPLDQGGVYVDLDDLGRGPFKAMGSQSAGPDNRFVAKRDTDYELWDRLVGQGRTAQVERPG
jgi:hypothetical protein